MRALDVTEMEMKSQLRRLCELVRRTPPGRFRRSIEHNIAGQQRKLNRLRERRNAAERAA